jgi:hypothetical protein
MLPLILSIPKNEYPEKGQISPIKVKHPTMLYWIDNFGKFYKTYRNIGEKSEKDSIIREQKIFKLFNGKSPSSYINIPNEIITWDNKLIVSQKKYNQGDFMDYILKGNSGLNSVIIFLKSIRNILPILDSNNIIYGDFAFENFMIQCNDNNNLKKLILVDFGQSMIFDLNKNYSFNPDKLKIIRPFYQSPDLFLNYKSKIMSGTEIYNILLKKDLFVIGILTLNLLTNNEIWDTKDDFRDRLDDINYIRYQINCKLSENINSSLKIVFKIILSLVTTSLKSITNLKELYNLIDKIEVKNYKKRKFS